MKINRTCFYLIFLFAMIIIIPFAIYEYKNHNLTHLTCSASYSAINESNFFISNNSLMLNGDGGTWMMDGKITYKDMNPLFFKLRNSFKFERKKFSYHFHSQKVSVILSDSSGSGRLNEFLAAIITKEGQDSFFYIYPVNKDYLIYSGTMPVMYCQTNKLHDK